MATSAAGTGQGSGDGEQQGTAQDAGQGQQQQNGGDAGQQQTAGQQQQQGDQASQDQSQGQQGSWLDTLPQEAQNEIKRLRGESASRRTELQSARDQIKQFEDRDKTEQQRAQERADNAEREAQEANAKLLRYEVAAEKGVPANQAHRLVGSTKEELAADADAFLESLGGGQQGGGAGAPDFGAGARGQSAESGQDMSSLIRQQAGYGG